MSGQLEFIHIRSILDVTNIQTIIVVRLLAYRELYITISPFQHPYVELDFGQSPLPAQRPSHSLYRESHTKALQVLAPEITKQTTHIPDPYQCSRHQSSTSNQKQSIRKVDIYSGTRFEITFRSPQNVSHSTVNASLCLLSLQKNGKSKREHNF